MGKAYLGGRQGRVLNERHGQDEMRDYWPRRLIDCYRKKVDEGWGDRKDDRPLPCEICNKARARLGRVMV